MRDSYENQGVDTEPISPIKRESKVLNKDLSMNRIASSQMLQSHSGKSVEKYNQLAAITDVISDQDIEVFSSGRKNQGIQNNTNDFSMQVASFDEDQMFKNKKI